MYHENLVEIKTARQSIDILDEIRREQGISQRGMADIMNDPDLGQKYARAYGSGDARISYIIKAANKLGVKVYFSKWGNREP